MLMQVVCVEAQMAKGMVVAKQALSMLWKEAMATQGPSAKPGDDAVIARNLIKTMIGWIPLPILGKMCIDRCPVLGLAKVRVQ